MTDGAPLSPDGNTTLEPRSPGRPRRFDDDSERRMVLDAALEVLARNGYVDAGVNDVLTASGVSTRALYRHFPTKDDLMVALYVRDGEVSAQLLRRAVDAAPDPSAAVVAWIDAFLDVFYAPKKVARVALFNSPGIRSAVGYAEAESRIYELLTAPLVEALETGHQVGALHSPAPDRDAGSIYGLLASVSEYLGGHRLEDRATARAQVLRFCGPALRLDHLT
ncbi:MAG: TetR/AcrR family transcriptional regulator [Acidimicrobiales bacterium]